MKKISLYLISLLMFSACSNSLETELSSFSAVTFNEDSAIDPYTFGKDTVLHDQYNTWNNQDIVIKKGVIVEVDNLIMVDGSITVEEGGQLLISTMATVVNVDFNLINGGSVCSVPDVENMGIYINGKPLGNGECYSEADLPVEMISFNTKLEGQNAQLNWATASEVNSASFIVERSIDQRNWTAIKEIKAAGNSNTRIDYTYTDENVPSASIVYYRLKQIDMDGAFAYYGPNAVKVQASNTTLTVYPNPVTFGENVNILTNFDKMSVRIYDASGRTYFETQTELNHIQLPMNFGKGMLFVEVKDGSKKATQKLIVN